MAEIFANSGGVEANLGIPAPNLLGDFIPGIDIPDFQDGFGLITPLGGGPTTRRYQPYGVSPEDSWQDTQLQGLQFAPAESISYNLEGLIGPQGIPGRDGRDGVTTIIGLPAYPSFMATLPHNIAEINALGTAVDKLVYTETYTTVREIEDDVLCTGTVDGNALGTIAKFAWETNDWSEIVVNLTPSIDIVEGNLYTIKIEADGDGDGGWAYACAEHPGTYEGGEVYKQQDEETEWVLHESGVGPTGYHIWFNTGTDSYLFTPPTAQYQGIGVGVLNNGSNYRKAMIFTATSDYSLSSITLTMAREQDDNPGNLTISISNATELYSEATWAEASLTSAGRDLLADTTAAAQATTLGLGTGDAVTHDTLTLSSITAEGTDVDKFLVDSTGVIKYRTGAEVLSDIGGSGSGHLHDGATLEHDGVNSDGGAFSFTTTGLVTFNQSIAAANYAAANLLTAAATNAGGLDFSAASKTLTVAESITVGAVIDDLNSLTPPASDGQFIVATGAGTFAYESTTTARTSLGVGTGDSPTFAGATITGCAVLGLNSTVFQPNTDSTTFFQVLDADGGTPIFNVDTTNERVGIGTISPYSGLHYQGDIFYLTPAAGPESNDNITIKNYATGNGAPDIILRTADIAGAYGIGVGTLSLIGGSKTTHYGGIGHGGGKISLQGGQGRDAANDPSYYAPVLLQPTSGNVGIGTTAPNAPLEVKGAKPGVVGGWQSGQLQVTGSGGEFYCAVITGHNAFNGNTQLWYLGNTSSSSHNDVAFINRQNAAMHFYTNNASRMTIDAAGNVTLATIAAEGSDVDKFLVSSSGVVKYRTGTQVLSDIGASASGHNHSGIYEPADAGLTSLAGLTYASDSFIKVTATDTYAIRTIAETKTDLSLNNVSNVATDDTAYNATSWNANTDAATKNAIRDKVETIDTAIGLNTTHRGLSSGNPHSVTPTELSLIIGTDTQAWDASLDSVAGLTYVSPSFIKLTAEDTYAVRTIGETADDLQGTIDHDLTANYDANKHVDHTGITLTAGSGIAGGGDISAGRTFDLDINSLAAAGIAAGDFVPFWDITATATNKKITFANFEAALNHDALTNYAANEHYTQASITATGTVASGTWEATDVAIAHGGTGQSTAQAAIDALSAVGGATNEHVLTKDTASGNAIWKAAAAAGGAGGGTTCLFAWFYDSVIQGTWAIGVDALQLFGGYIYTSTFNNGDEINFKTYLGAGTYTLKIIHIRNTDEGIVDIYIDAAEVASFDFYGTVLYNNIQTQASISVAAGGVKTIRAVIDGKNGSSSAYKAPFTALIFYRTA